MTLYAAQVGTYANVMCAQFLRFATEKTDSRQQESETATEETGSRQQEGQAATEETGSKQQESKTKGASSDPENRWIAEGQKWEKEYVASLVRAGRNVQEKKRLVVEAAAAAANPEGEGSETNAGDEQTELTFAELEADVFEKKESVYLSEPRFSSATYPFLGNLKPDLILFELKDGIVKITVTEIKTTASPKVSAQVQVSVYALVLEEMLVQHLVANKSSKLDSKVTMCVYHKDGNEGKLNEFDSELAYDATKAFLNAISVNINDNSILNDDDWARSARTCEKCPYRVDCDAKTEGTLRGLFLSDYPDTAKRLLSELSEATGIKKDASGGLVELRNKWSGLRKDAQIRAAQILDRLHAFETPETTGASEAAGEGESTDDANNPSLPSKGIHAQSARLSSKSADYEFYAATGVGMQSQAEAPTTEILVCWKLVTDVKLSQAEQVLEPPDAGIMTTEGIMSGLEFAKHVAETVPKMRTMQIITLTEGDCRVVANLLKDSSSIFDATHVNTTKLACCEWDSAEFTYSELKTYFSDYPKKPQRKELPFRMPLVVSVSEAIRDLYEVPATGKGLQAVASFLPKKLQNTHHERLEYKTPAAVNEMLGQDRQLCEDVVKSLRKKKKSKLMGIPTALTKTEPLTVSLRELMHHESRLENSTQPSGCGWFKETVKFFHVFAAAECRQVGLQVPFCAPRGLDSILCL
ncbi:hypothetical protein DIPPA_04810 [Diplonema papillatum]|nr:hypothetical protein DIPPA_04810 [Diplonema papillatum]